MIIIIVIIIIIIVQSSPYITHVYGYMTGYMFAERRPETSRGATEEWPRLVRIRKRNEGSRAKLARSTPKAASPARI